MITQQTIQQITNRIDILDVVGEFVKLKKRGANYLGLCPFHGEKTPSFTVSPAKEIYKCFGCGKSGNSISFLMELEKYSYVEALRWLANRYHIEIEETQVSPEVRQHQQVAESLHIINGFAQKYFAEQLWQTQEGEAVAQSYLEERGFRREISEKFQLGYSPQNRHSFVTAALQKQYNAELLVKTGLVVNRNEELLDNYRGRIIFPIHNNTGKVIGFGARVIGKAEKVPKYINTPENEIYVKSRILYGAYFARQSIDKQDECLLVEGYTDVISLHQAGIENVVASGGTSLTTDQLRIIKKYTNNLTIIYDGDSAGIKAALRGLDMALEESLNVKLVLIPDKEDPDSYVNKVGANAFREFVAEHKKDFILFQLEIMLKDAGNDVSRKNDVVNQIAETLSKINKTEDFTKQQEYIRQCSGILRIDETGLTTLVNKYKRDRIQRDEKRFAQFDNGNNNSNNQGNNMPGFDMPPDDMPPQDNMPFDDASLLANQDEPHEKNLLRVLMEYGLRAWDEEKTMAQYIFDELEQFEFDSAPMEQLYEEYRRQYFAGMEPTNKTLLYIDNADIRNLVVNITMNQFELSHRWDDKQENMNILNRDISHKDVQLSVHYFKLRKIKKMFDQNQRDMEQATTYEEQVKLIEIHKHLKQIEQELTKQYGTVIFK
ncbi:DNA primase [Deminuibacter soli]|uniref:DNA primase n=1 Tax=Deminuibacter soli TaxID=2291815 RepID=A0A3E1NGW8_9BACT|nr:DNA primase [Deminuibacter soli]RFM27190.1 DNA primase [Deminuibacter soli]